MPLGVGVAHVIFSAEYPRHSSESWNPWGRTDAKTALRLYLASRRHGTLYVGVRSDLARRVWQHKNDVLPGVTRRCARLVWYEPHECMAAAIARERAIKAWKRQRKIELIDRGNPQWLDLYEELG